MSRLVRWSAVLGAALVLTFLAVVPAYADETWCDVDPALPLKNAAGQTIVVHLDTQGPSANVLAMKHPDQSYVITNDGLYDYVSLTLTYEDLTGTGDPLISEIWTGANRTGTLLSSRSGTFGQAVVHSFAVSRT